LSHSSSSAANKASCRKGSILRTLAKGFQNNHWPQASIKGHVLIVLASSMGSTYHLPEERGVRIMRQMREKQMKLFARLKRKRSCLIFRRSQGPWVFLEARKETGHPKECSPSCHTTQNWSIRHISEKCPRATEDSTAVRFLSIKVRGRGAPKDTHEGQVPGPVGTD
jgi:hypothetical protein